MKENSGGLRGLLRPWEPLPEEVEISAVQQFSEQGRSKQFSAHCLAGVPDRPLGSTRQEGSSKTPKARNRKHPCHCLASVTGSKAPKGWSYNRRIVCLRNEDLGCGIA